MEDLKKFCEKHSIEMAYDIEFRHFIFIKGDQTFKYYFYRTNDLRGEKELESYSKDHLIERLKQNFEIEED